MRLERNGQKFTLKGVNDNDNDAIGRILNNGYDGNTSGYSPEFISLLSFRISQINEAHALRQKFTKICSRCHEEKWLFEFAISRENLIPFRHDCKTCQRSTRAEYVKTSRLHKAEMTQDITSEALVEVLDGVPMTTSLIIAEYFGKEHKNVLQSIEKILEYDCVRSCSRLKFQPRDYTDDRGKEYPMYSLNEEAFHLVVMGFTGAKAMAWKVRFIEAFSELKALAKHQQGIVNQLKSFFIGIIKDQTETLLKAFKAHEQALSDEIIQTKRKDPPPQNKVIYKKVVWRFFDRRCPICGEHIIIDHNGCIVNAEYHHLRGKSYNALDECILTCKSCNRKIGKPSSALAIEHQTSINFFIKQARNISGETGPLFNREKREEPKGLSVV